MNRTKNRKSVSCKKKKKKLMLKIKTERSRNPGLNKKIFELDFDEPYKPSKTRNEKKKKNRKYTEHDA